MPKAYRLFHNRPIPISMPTQRTYSQEDLPWEPIRKPPRFSPYLRAKVYLFYCAIMAIAVGLLWFARRCGDRVDLSTLQVENDTTQLFATPCPNLDSLTVASRWLNINHLSYRQLVALGLQPALAARATIGRADTFGSLREFWRTAWYDSTFTARYRGRLYVPKPKTVRTLADVSYRQEYHHQKRATSPKPQALFSFNPNIISKDSLVLLGFSPKQAQSILNYRSKGGTFRKVEDFKKLYVVDSACYKRLAPYIQLDKTRNVTQKRVEPEDNSQQSNASPNHSEPANSKPKSQNRWHPFPFNPNTITKDSLVLLGFSPKQAQTILNYRAKGGAFRKVEDFKKLYVVDSTCYERLKGYIRLE